MRDLPSSPASTVNGPRSTTSVGRDWRSTDAATGRFPTSYAMTR